MTQTTKAAGAHRLSLPLSRRDEEDLARLRDGMAEDSGSPPSQASVAHEAFRRGLDVLWAEQQEREYVELGEELRASAQSRHHRAQSRRRGTAGPQ